MLGRVCWKDGALHGKLLKFKGIAPAAILPVETGARAGGIRESRPVRVRNRGFADNGVGRVPPLTAPADYRSYHALSVL